LGVLNGQCLIGRARFGNIAFAVLPVKRGRWMAFHVDPSAGIGRVVISMIQLDIRSNIAQVQEALRSMPNVVEKVLARSVKRALISGRAIAIASIFRAYNLRERTIREAFGTVQVHVRNFSVVFPHYQ
jgi:hypothetical protein